MITAADVAALDVPSFAAVMLLAFACGSLVGGCVGTEYQRHRAMHAGVGRWTIDAKTGESHFSYGVGTTKGGNP